MSALSVQVPFPVFQDRDGQPLDNGYIWIGEPNLSPQVNPVNVYFDEALTTLAPQPLRTLNGYVSRAGTPSQIYVDGVSFSILVQDSKGSMVYNFPDGTGVSPDACGVTYDPPFTGGVPYPVCEKLAQTVSVMDFGAVGDGVADDTAAIQAAVDAVTSGGVLTFPAGTYSVNAPINVTDEICIDISGATIVNSTNDIFVFYVTSSNVTVENGVFTGNQIGIMQIGVLASWNTTYSNISVLNNQVNCTGNKPVVQTYATTPNLQFRNNVCVATGATAGYPWVSSGLRINITPSGSYESASGYIFTNNKFDGYQAAFNSEIATAGYVFGGCVIEANIILNSDIPIRTYHLRNCKVVNNYINTYTTSAYAWQQSEWRGNTFKNYTGSDAAVKIEALLSVFAYNIIDTSAASGILYDGEGASGVISNNTIRNVTEYGINFFPTYDYGGQPVSVEIKDNVIYGCGSDGIYVHSADSIRGIHIDGNRISGIGRTGAGGVDYAAIRIDTTASRSILAYIKNNTLFGNDNLYGIQNSTFSIGIWINDSAQAMASCLIADNDISISTPLLYSIRSSSGTNIVCTGNRVTSYASLSNVDSGSQVVAGNQTYPNPITEFGTDLDDYNYDGAFTTPNGGLSNLPSGWIQARYTVVVFGANDSNSGMQIIMGRNTDSNDIAVRTKYNGTWKTWRIL